MTFKEYIILKGIPFQDFEDEFFVRDEDIAPHEEEVRRLFPEYKMIQEYIRYEGVPKSVSDAHKS